MAWYHRLLGIEEKLNPGQILDRGKQEGTRELILSYEMTVSYTHMTLTTNSEV